MRNMTQIGKFFVTTALFFTFIMNSVLADSHKTKPNTQLSPSDVINIVIDALKNNDSANGDDGIATVFEFASPNNRSVTGPLPRFTKMIKGGFEDMLNHTSSEFSKMDITDDTALQAVWLTSRSGTQTGYVFQLGKQKAGKFKGMWMTESVMPIGTRKPQGQSI